MGPSGNPNTLLDSQSTPSKKKGCPYFNVAKQVRVGIVFHIHNIFPYHIQEARRHILRKFKSGYRPHTLFVCAIMGQLAR
jgi:hypothetical protein